MKMTNRLEEFTLINYSVEAAKKALTKELGRFEMVERSLAVNSWAHGYYMGWRKAEEGRPRRTGFFSRLFPHADLTTTSEQAASYYIKSRFPSISSDHKTIVGSCVAIGFRKGYMDFVK